MNWKFCVIWPCEEKNHKIFTFCLDKIFLRVYNHDVVGAPNPWGGIYKEVFLL